MSNAEQRVSEFQEAERRIAWILEHEGVNAWLKNALRTALESDPIDVLNDLELLRVLLTPRADALIRMQLDSLNGIDDKFTGNFNVF